MIVSEIYVSASSQVTSYHLHLLPSPAATHLVGVEALFQNVTGGENTAIGFEAAFNNNVSGDNPGRRLFSTFRQQKRLR